VIVADTSLIATLLIPTAANALAEAVLRKDSQWMAPLLWRYEFRNALVTQSRFKGLRLEKAASLFEHAERVIIEPYIEVEPAVILRLALTRKLSAYDAEFVAIAHALALKLVTLDRGILRAVPEIALSPEAFMAA
jgi:predicted nucleic acid-binding protein